MRTKMGADVDLILVYRKDVREIEKQLNEIVYVDGEQLIELVGEKAVGFSINY